MPQLTWAQTEFATVKDVTDRIRETDIILLYEGDNLDGLIQQKINWSKDILRQDLVNYFQEKIPGFIPSMLAFKRSQVNLAQSQFSRNLELLDRGTGSWNYPTYGYMTFDGLFLDVNGYAAYGQVPYMYFNWGIPVSGTQGTMAGLANNGSILADIKYRNLYINRETNDPPVSPVWQLFQPSDAINWIINPTELVHVQVSSALLAMAKEGMFVNRVNFQKPENLSLADFTVNFWKNERKGDLDRGLSLVDIDISGSGTMNDWKRGFTRSEVVICG